MRALRYARYGPPEVLEVVDLPEPEPGPGELLVRVGAASLNPLDWKIRSGHLRFVPIADRPPRGVGCDFAGTVVGTGGGATGFFPGARVFGTLSPFRRQGSCAERIVVAVDRVAATPAGVGDTAAAALPIAAGTAVQALADHARLARGQRVVVVGAAGGVGHFAVQYAKHVGARVTGVCGPDNVDFVRALGADDVVDYSRDRWTDAERAFDVVFDTTGHTRWRECRRVLSSEGVYLNTSPDAASVATTMADALRARATTRQRVVPIALKGGAEAWRRLAELAAAGAIVAQVRETIGLAGVADAMRRMEAGHGRGKVVVDVSR